MQTLITIPEQIKEYLEKDNVPLIEVNGTKWYYITKQEKEIFENFVKDVDKIPENIWRKYPESEILEIAHLGNLADRIARNSITKER